jgi:hypothetical protein
MSNPKMDRSKPKSVCRQEQWGRGGRPGEGDRLGEGDRKGRPYNMVAWCALAFEGCDI